MGELSGTGTAPFKNAEKKWGEEGNISRVKTCTISREVGEGNHLSEIALGRPHRDCEEQEEEKVR